MFLEIHAVHLTTHEELYPLTTQCRIWLKYQANEQQNNELYTVKTTRHLIIISALANTVHIHCKKVKVWNGSVGIPVTVDFRILSVTSYMS